MKRCTGWGRRWRHVASYSSARGGLRTDIRQTVDCLQQAGRGVQVRRGEREVWYIAWLFGLVSRQLISISTHVYTPLLYRAIYWMPLLNKLFLSFSSFCRPISAQNRRSGRTIYISKTEIDKNKIHVQTNTKSVQCLCINTKHNKVRITQSQWTSRKHAYWRSLQSLSGKWKWGRQMARPWKPRWP